MSDQKICPTCGAEFPLSERFCPRDGTALRAPAAGGDLLGTVVADRYHILRKLGEGGMGQVYLAEHVKMGRKSALKVMNPGMNQDADAVARFNREASNASRLSHPNICAIYDFGETPDGLIYLAMEYIEGQSLTALVRGLGTLPPARAARIIHQAAEALQAAHDAGIVHRDLKPDNIMIARNRDGSDLAKVVDFGIAKAHGRDAQKVTRTGMVVGTPEYMSPEQLAGDTLDGRSDIYSLGLVAFNCLTGKLPFLGESAQDAMIARLVERPRTLAEMKPDVPWPAAVQAVMDTALGRDAGERYQSAAQFGRELSMACEQMPASHGTTDGTQVMGATEAVGTVPTTRIAAAGDGGRAVAAPVAVKRRHLGMMAAVVVGIAVLGGGGYFIVTSGGARTAADSVAKATPPAAAAAETATVPASSKVGGGAGEATPLKMPIVNGANGGDGARLVAEWLPNAGALTESSARRAIGDLEKAAYQMSGETQGNAFYILGAAYFRMNNADDGCNYWTKARPLVSGNSAEMINRLFATMGCK